ncbi:MAG: hypothetical protein WAZ18_05880 [Alphaproteobacteria bacterium]
MLKKFATQVDAKVLEELRLMAHAQGRQVQAVLGEALVDYLAQIKQGQVRPAVLNGFQRSTVEFGEVYKALVGGK